MKKLETAKKIKHLQEETTSFQEYDNGFSKNHMVLERFI